MKIYRLLLAVAFLFAGMSFSAAAAAPPATPMPGTPSGLVPVKHAPYQALCTTGFAPSPTGYTYDVQDPSANYRCMAAFHCDTAAGFDIAPSWGYGVVGAPPTFSYVCFKYKAGSDRGALNCGFPAIFTAGPYQADTHTYKCTSGPLTCSPALSVNASDYALGTEYLSYRCGKAG